MITDFQLVPTTARRGLSLLGQSFYDLTVVNLCGRNEHGQLVWNCNCVCGNQRKVPGSWLRRGQAKHCGCKTHKAEAVALGSRFGNLLVTEKATKGCYWVVQCGCGRTFSAYQSNLLKGTTKACKHCGHYRKPQGVSAFNRLRRTYRRQAKNRGLVFDLSLDTFSVLVTSSCTYCEEPPSQSVLSNAGSFTYNGIDRVDNNIGYIESNSVPCCGVCNRMKGTLSREEFLQHVMKIMRATPAAGERIVVETNSSLANPINLQVA